MPECIGIDSFVHPTSCHKAPLELVRMACLTGDGNSVGQDIDRRRVWMGCVTRAIRRRGIELTNEVVTSRIQDFLTCQMTWAKIGMPPDCHEEFVANAWADLFHVLNGAAGEICAFFVACAADCDSLGDLRLFISTVSR